MISGKVIGTKIDHNGNIKVTTRYTLTDGSKHDENTRYNCQNFSKAKILSDVKRHCEYLMVKVYNLKQNQTLVSVSLGEIKYDCESAPLITKDAVYDNNGNVTTPPTIITIDDK